jgi:hypothetical protein
VSSKKRPKTAKTACDCWLNGQHDAGRQDEEGHDSLEGLLRADQNERNTDKATSNTSDGQRQDAPALAAQAPAVADRAGEVARGNGDVVGDVCGQRRVSEHDQGRERDQRAAACSRVDCAGDEAGDGKQHDSAGAQIHRRPAPGREGAGPVAAAALVVCASVIGNISALLCLDGSYVPYAMSQFSSIVRQHAHR